MGKHHHDHQIDQQVDVKVRPPSLYRVIMLNDDYTSMEFVIQMLQKYFSKTHEQAMKIMLEIHEDGSGMCGIYSFDIAQTKASLVMEEARKNQFPLRCILEAEEKGDQDD